MDAIPDYTLLDDPALLAARAEVRAELEEVAAGQRRADHKIVDSHGPRDVQNYPP